MGCLPKSPADYVFLWNEKGVQFGFFAGSMLLRPDIGPGAFTEENLYYV